MIRPLKAHSAQGASDKMGAEAGLQPVHAVREDSKYFRHRKALDLSSQNDRLEQVFPDVDADKGWVFEDIEKRAYALDRLGIPCSWHKVVPLVGELVPEPEARVTQRRCLKARIATTG